MAGLENILGVNSTVGEVFDKHWAVSAKSSPSCTLVMKNIGKCWNLPLDQTMLRRAPPLKCLANSRVVGASSVSPLINPNGDILIPEKGMKYLAK